MHQTIEPASGGAKAPFWTRVVTFLRSMDEAVSRTGTDDLIDRIDALERRVDALTPSEVVSNGSSADHRP